MARQRQVVTVRGRDLSDEAFALLLILPLIALTLLLTAYPLVQSLWTSFQHQVTTPTLHYVFAGLDNYANALGDSVFVDGAILTVEFVLLTITLSVLIGLGLALLLNEAFQGRGILRALILLPWAVSEYATGLIWKFIYRQDIGFINTALQTIGAIQKGITWITPDSSLIAVAIAYSWHMAPLAAIFFLASLQFIPPDLHRQAMIDGAGRVRRFLLVTLPYIRYPTLVMIILVAVFSSRTVDIFITLTGGGPGFSSAPLTYVVYVRTFTEFNLAYGAALSWYLILIVMALVMMVFLLMTRPSRLFGVR